MFLFTRSIPLLVALGFLLCAGLALRNPLGLQWLPPLFFVLLLGLGQMVIREDLRSRNYWMLMLTPLLLVISSFSFAAILANSFWRNMILIGVAVVLYWFFQNVFLFSSHDDRYQPHAIENISTYANLIVMFFFSSALAALLLYVHISPYAVLAGAAVPFSLLILQMLWVNKLALRTHRTYFFLLPMVLLQLFWVIFWLPTNFFVAGTLMSIAYYATTNLSRRYLLGGLKAVMVRRYLIIAFFGVIVTLASAQWT